MTTVEARGCPEPRSGRRARNRSGSVGRAAGAQMTGQCQDGPSHAPAKRAVPPVRARRIGAILSGATKGGE